MLRSKAISSMGSARGQLYDMNLRVKTEKEVKEFDMIDRNSNDVLIMLKKIKD